MTEVKHLEAPQNTKENKPKLKAQKVTPAVKIRNRNITMKESKPKIEHEMSEQDNPGYTPMEARIPLEVGHIVCTMYKKTFKLCLNCCV